MATAADHRLARLREDLLGGRGPGASPEEVAAHTRDRAVIGGAPASLDLALVERQPHRAREELSAASGIGREACEPTFWLILGAGGALLLRALLHHAIASRPRQHDDHHR